MENNKKKGQSLSADIMVVVVIVLFGAVFLVLNQINDTSNPSGDTAKKYEQASMDSDKIYQALKQKEVISSENNVNVQKMIQIDQDMIKQELGIQNDFAIVFEKDGYLVKIDPTNNVTCIGSGKISVNDYVCS